jgi:peptide/nickel transport system permease protein
MPRRFRTWVLVWTPVLWVVLEMATFPKDRPATSGFTRVLGGLVDKSVAPYPAWVVLALALVCASWGAYSFVRRARARLFTALVLVEACVFSLWGAAAGGAFGGGFSLFGQHASSGWLYQTVALLVAGAAVLAWAAGNPDRAELTAWNTHEIWRLFRGNWQGMAGLIILVIFVAVALFAPLLADHALLDPNAQIKSGGHFIGLMHAPSSYYYNWLGTDDSGRSVLAELIWSARISLVVGLLATAISTVLGAAIGIAAGYFGGWSGEGLMRLTDVFLVIPWLPLCMVLASVWGRSYWMIILIIGITSWPGTARVVRSDTLRVRELQFIERARAIGSKSGHIMTKHVLPNVFPLIFANTVLVVAIAILSETTLSFLGLGDPLNFSWGTMLNYAWHASATAIPRATAWVLAPGFAIVLVVLAFTFMGTAFDEVLDPKLRKREERGGDRFAGVEAPAGTPAAATGDGGSPAAGGLDGAAAGGLS